MTTCSCRDQLLRLGHDRDGHALAMLLIRERGWRRGDEPLVRSVPDIEMLRISGVGPRRLADLRDRLRRPILRLSAVPGVVHSS